MPVIPLTVNTTADMERPMDLGVDAIISDYRTRFARFPRAPAARHCFPLGPVIP
ncbi:glycerophosphoryl diester phosphodiesterase [Arthrobacter sp. UYCu723]